jgi:hypothetical protein
MQQANACNEWAIVIIQNRMFVNMSNNVWLSLLLVNFDVICKNEKFEEFEAVEFGRRRLMESFE